MKKWLPQLIAVNLESKKEMMMVEQITDSWWKLTYRDLERDRNVVFFGYTEDQVREKFCAWFSRVTWGQK